MDLYAVIDQVIDLLRKRGRLTYRALQYQFKLDDEGLAALKEELIEGYELAVDKDGKMLVWKGEGSASPASVVLESSSPQGERRQLTVMFCDLVGSTALSEQLDPEELHDLIRSYQSTCSQIIQRYDGFIAQYLGDGLLVYFGYPSAHEDDARRAVRAGLEMTEQLQTLPSPYPLHVRIGIHTGQVVVGEIGGGEKREHLALGDTPNIAARVQGRAEPDCVVISSGTYHLVQGFFECQELGPQALKGLAEPLTLYTVLREGAAQDHFDVSLQTGLTPLVGREEESALLQRLWARAQAGEGQVALISGEPGIGKSRLVQVLKDSVGVEQHEGGECRCSAFYQSSALYPIVQRLQEFLHIGPEESNEQKLHKLEQALNQYRFASQETIPLVASLLSIPLPDSYPALTLSPEKHKEKTLDVLVTWLQHAAERQPVWLVVEDLHWADPSTLELLGVLIERIPTTHMLLVLTFRPEFTPPWPLRSHMFSLTLSRFLDTHVAQMAQRVARGQSLPVEVIQQLVIKTDGVPLFVEEMTKNVLESGMLEAREGRYVLTGPLTSLAIPSTLQDSLMARLDRLQTAREVAQLGATIGREFSYRLVRAISSLSDALLQDGLRELGQAELVYQRGVPPESDYTFKHALIQDVAYQSLLKSKRQQLHDQLAQVLAEKGGRRAIPPELVAHHYTEARRIEQALVYWQQAGEKAVERFGSEEAIQHFSTGLELLKTLADTPQRTSQELVFQAALSPVLMAARGWSAPEVGEAYTRALELCRQVRDSPQLLPVLGGLWAYYAVRAELQTAHELGDQLLHLANKTASPDQMLQAHFIRDCSKDTGLFSSCPRLM